MVILEIYFSLNHNTFFFIKSGVISASFSGGITSGVVANGGLTILFPLNST
jgi:hypothetical protein